MTPGSELHRQLEDYESAALLLSYRANEVGSGGETRTPAGRKARPLTRRLPSLLGHTGMDEKEEAGGIAPHPRRDTPFSRRAPALPDSASKKIVAPGGTAPPTFPL